MISLLAVVPLMETDFVGGPRQGSHAQALQKSEESGIQGQNRPTETLEERGVVNGARTRDDTGRHGA